MKVDDIHGYVSFGYKTFTLIPKMHFVDCKDPSQSAPPPSLAQHASFVRTCMVPVNSNNFFLFQR